MSETLSDRRHGQQVQKLSMLGDTRTSTWKVLGTLALKRELKSNEFLGPGKN